VDSYDVVWPKAPRGVEPGRLADRLTALEDRRIGFVWDYVFRGDEIFPIIERELADRFPDVEIVSYETFGNSHGGDEAQWTAAFSDLLAIERIDAVISGIGC